ncbi:glycosyltransferase-like domain-containing protein 1-like [Anopheles ziemanni]|uniref:glycosyltransferase-like domain-containing protein 1-like n=1 Tax=Anopheles coustani TaxID=139045 RepID=UPI002659A52D|nr:glycosyltransferase-like domain-containing protein 1-like [Anopheles coustani]XP_058166489.1 glycosyltransferase-like domain-containing protein 1-like [Anopheles ziemanni]
MAYILTLEAFYGGSHKQLLDIILKNFNRDEYDLFTIPAKKWHWCARMSALQFAQNIPTTHAYRTIFCSSVLNLAELIGMRPDLASCRKVVYFHENQLSYPVRESKSRDVQYGVNQITTCLCADLVLFNSKYNMSSFLGSIQSFLNIVPNMSFKGIREKIEPKCEVLYFPIDFQHIPSRSAMNTGLQDREKKPLHLIWPHRWEHDKNPEQLVDALVALQGKNVDFHVSILGERFETVPKCFENIQQLLPGKVIHFGPLPKVDYYRTLAEGDVVLSTALHEFYGVAMLEAVHCGCVPLAPNRLVYPELYPKDKLFNTTAQLVKQLYNWCRNRSLFEKHREAFFNEFSFEYYAADKLIPRYVSAIKHN